VSTSEATPGVVTGPTSALKKSDPNSSRLAVGAAVIVGREDVDGTRDGSSVKLGADEGYSDGGIDAVGLMLGLAVRVGSDDGYSDGPKLGSVVTVGCIDGCREVLGGDVGDMDGDSD